MISFDYSFKKAKFQDLENGDFFILSDKSEILYMKVPRVQVYSILNSEPTGLSKCLCNGYNLERNEFEEFDKDMLVIKCEANIIAKPQI